MHAHVISGSIALDRILVTDSLFGDHLMPEHLHRISLALTMERLEESWGGTGANIAYGLAQLGDLPRLVGAIGEDLQAVLRSRWDQLGILHDGVLTVPAKTAVATIFTDRNHNQITGFHPGALNHSHEVNLVEHLPRDYSGLVILAPESPQTMLRHALALQQRGLAYAFDPGQTLSVLSSDAIRKAAAGATLLLVNDYEMAMLEKSTGHNASTWGRTMAQRNGALIVTHGAQGCEIWTEQPPVTVKAAPAERIVDPTGCGDAFRAGLLYGRARGENWVRAAEMGAALAAIQIAHPGGQQYVTNATEVLALRDRAFATSSQQHRSGSKPR